MAADIVEDKVNSKNQEASVEVSVMVQLVAADLTVLVVHSKEVIHRQLRHRDSVTRDQMEVRHTRMVRHHTLDSLKKIDPRDNRFFRPI